MKSDSSLPDHTMLLLQIVLLSDSLRPPDLQS
jgi:hypothetical protein